MAWVSVGFVFFAFEDFELVLQMVCALERKVVASREPVLFGVREGGVELVGDDDAAMARLVDLRAK